MASTNTNTITDTTNDTASKSEVEPTEETVSDNVVETTSEVNYIKVAQDKRDDLLTSNESGELVLKEGLSEEQKAFASVLKVNDALSKKTSEQMESIALLNKRVASAPKIADVAYTDEQEEALEQAKLEGDFKKIAQLVNDFSGSDKEVELNDDDKAELNRIAKIDELDNYSIGEEFNGGSVNWEDLVPPVVMKDYIAGKVKALDVVRYSKSIMTSLKGGKVKSPVDKPPTNLSLNGIASTSADDKADKDKNEFSTRRPVNSVSEDGKIKNTRGYI